ncbi:siderophore-interacting protein [Breoghania sp. L-A4]|uniref:siderophore-interacting protein n=1 Tax=Breoghania sp. L-A4 TaxID=2304600 RepID=UPI000E35A7F8|nr:siderophore-interacting protein [Breoghania sp. L-A4]AXS40760.1 siderophore-interacting protein [Breoghania sp. L-A4]
MPHIQTPSTASRYEGDVPDGLIEHIRSHVEEFGLPVDASGARLTVRYADSEVALQAGRASLDVTITAGTEISLHKTRESVIYLLDHVFPQASASMAWSGVDTGRRHPPNFHFASVSGVRRVSANFMRIEMDCDAIAALSSGGMHFSLLLPPKGHAPVWPALNAMGRTTWPDGDDALHRAAYTFVDLDEAAGRFTFDLFEHDGGRTTQWARAVKPGAVVGIAGPGGGDFPQGDRLFMAGDETAIPAIRRILAASPDTRQGTVFIETGDPADRCDLPRPASIDVHWTERGTEPDLLTRIKETTLPADETFVWVAAEQSLVRAARDHFRKSGVARTSCYFSAYWTR